MLKYPRSHGNNLEVLLDTLYLNLRYRRVGLCVVQQCPFYKVSFSLFCRFRDVSEEGVERLSGPEVVVICSKAVFAGQDTALPQS